MPGTQEILQRANDLLIANYARQPLVMVRGEGSYVWDSDGKRYLDLFAGFGGSILGHCHPALIAAATQQAQKLWHVGNTFHTQPQIELAERLNRFAFRGQAFFCHSGAEANEAACKLARLRGNQANPKRWKIITLNKSFHGRTLAMISATGNPQVRAGFEPNVPGFVQVEPGDFEALKNAVDDQTAAVLMEPIQGEGGINLYPEAYARQIRQLCNDRGLTLIFDEVWTGCGRTGRWFGYQHFTQEGSGFRVQGSEKDVILSAAKNLGSMKDPPNPEILRSAQDDNCLNPEPRTLNPLIEPDIMTLGKAVGGGLPVGVMFAKTEIAKLLVPGKHGCTIGGNPICMSVANTIFDVIEREHLLQHAASLGEHALSRLRNEPKIKQRTTEVRGRGLFLGIELKDEPQKLVERGLERGIIINLTAKKIVRLAPAINITRQQWDEGLDKVVEVIAGPS